MVVGIVCALRWIMMLYLIIVYLGAPKSLRPRKRGMPRLLQALSLLLCSAISAMLQPKILLSVQCLLTGDL